MADRKLRYAVLTYFEKYYKIGNKARYQWDADNLVESYSLDEIKQVIDYYATVTRDPSWTKFVYDFDTYKEAMANKSRDIAQRKANLEKMRVWMNE